MRKLSLVTMVLAMGIASFVSADEAVDGTWEGKVENRRGTLTLTFRFKVDGDKLTGKIETRRGESDISEGKVEGDTISFKQHMSFRDREMTLLYTGKISGDEIKFTREVEGMERKSEFTAKRKE
jgi:hypothetical protein